jgi:hypothetical protein
LSNSKLYSSMMKNFKNRLYEVSTFCWDNINPHKKRIRSL